MSKPNPRTDTTLEEMEELLSQPDANEGQFAEYLQRKLKEKQPPANNGLLFGSVSFDFDFDVNVVKKPAPTVSTGDNADVVASAETKETPANPQAAENNQPTPLPAARNSPNSSPNRVCSKNVPGSDKLRRRAIRRLSQSCGRKLLKEFEVSSSSSGTFKPVVFSTPCARQPQMDVDVHVKEMEGTPQMIQPKEPEAEKPAENSQVETEPKKCLTSLDSRTVDTAAEASLMLRERLSSFQKNILQLDYTGHAPSSDGAGCTYTIEKGPAPGQLLLSPSRRSSSCTAAQKRPMPIAKVRRQREEVLIPDTPPRPHTRGSEQEPEYVVPDTQFQELGELVQNLSRNASGPIVVINTANSKPIAELTPAQPVSVAAPVPTALTLLHRASTEVAAENYNSSPAAVAASPAKHLESPKSSRKSLVVINNADAIMTDDESDEHPSTVAMNLAHRGGDGRQQPCLRKHRPPTPDPEKENSVQLLNLHRSNNAKKSKQKTKPATVPLNKAPCAPINGEQFAQELARMSNYEILDLRKRNSLGKVYPVDGQRKTSTVQQLDLERSIQRELMRRNLKISGDRLTGSNAAAEPPESEEMLPSSVANTNRNIRQGSQSKNQSPREFDESAGDAALPPPPHNFDDTKKRAEPPCSSRREQMESSDDGEALPPRVLRNFKDSRRRLQRSKRSSRCNTRILSDESSDENETPPVPSNTQDSRKQTRSLRSGRQIQKMSEKLEDDSSCIPPPAPSAFKDRRSSRSRPMSSQESSDENNAPPVPCNFQDSRKQAQRSLRFNRQSQLMSDNSEDDASFIPPPAPNAFRDKRPSRSRLRSSHESKELTNYLMISKTMEMRRTSRSSTKRKLYTKGDSNAEGSDLESPKKPKRNSQSYSRSEVNSQGDNIAVVPPPPNSLRYSQSLRDLRHMDQIDSENAPLGGQESNENAICTPQTELDGTVEQALLSPPTEYNKPESGQTDARSDAPANKSRLESSNKIIAMASKTSEDPERQCVSSSQDKSTSQLNIVTDGEQPSTSRAAEKNKDKGIFKKPLKPAPRVKSKGNSRELENLMHSVIYKPTSLDGGSTCSDGLRRSKRGQVPLKYDWCHTQDIMELPFMSAYISKPIKKNTTAGKKRTTAATARMVNPLPDRGPVCSSTPRNPDAAVEPFQDSALGQHSTILTREPSAVADADSRNNQLRNWLLGISNVQPTKTNDQARAASLVEDLKFTELDGIEYAFYGTKETAALGYMRFKPHQVRNKKKVKACSLKFVVQIGEFAVQYGGIDEEEEESCVLREGDMVEIDKGSRYSIQNTLDAIGVIMVIRS